MSTTTPFNPATPSLSNNAVNVIFDSTYRFIGTPSTTVLGPYRGARSGFRIEGIAASTTQNVTLSLDVLDSASGTWTSGVTTQVVTAGTPQPISWLAPGADWRVTCTNGATGPGSLKFYGFQLVEGDRASGA